MFFSNILVQIPQFYNTLYKTYSTYYKYISLFHRTYALIQLSQNVKSTVHPLIAHFLLLIFCICINLSLNSGYIHFITWSVHLIWEGGK